LRFGLKDLSELPSLEEFEKLATAEMAEDLAPPSDAPLQLPDATGVPDDGGVEPLAEDRAEAPENATERPGSSDPSRDPADDRAGEHINSESNGG